MNHLVEHPRHGFLTISQNVQSLKHPAELFQMILENFYENHQTAAEKLVRGG